MKCTHLMSISFFDTSVLPLCIGVVSLTATVDTRMSMTETEMPTAFVISPMGEDERKS